MLNKNQLRLEIKQLLTQPFLQADSQKICERLLSLPQYRQAKTIFAFMPTFKEIDITPFLNQVISDKKQLCLPLCGENATMTARMVASLSELSQGSFGILEPASNSLIIEKSQIDFAVLPCFGADVNGNRLGKGGGYYDRFLQNSSFVKAVVVQDRFLYKEIPTESHDIKADIIVTQTQTVFCG